MAALALGHELFPLDQETGLADPRPVGGNVRVAPPHGNPTVQPVVIGPCLRPVSSYGHQHSVRRQPGRDPLQQWELIFERKMDQREE
jgi:hypothetical protein